jgi:protein TonB
LNFYIVKKNSDAARRTTMTFETFLTAETRAPDKRRAMTYGLALAMHGALLVVGVLRSAWHIEELSPPILPVTLLALGAPPPPPPPPPAARAKASPTRVKPHPTEVTQPTRDRVIPPRDQPPAPTPGSDDGVPGGVKDGVKGGVPGGPGTTPGPGPTKYISPTVARGQLAIDPQSDPYRVKLPPALASAGMVLWALLKICVKPDGQVQEVAILRGADPALDPLIVAAVRTWRYRPYTVDGRPVPFCTNVRYEITTR